MQSIPPLRATTLTRLSIEHLNRVSVDSWHANAEFWDDYWGSEGNDFYQILEKLMLERRVDLYSAAKLAAGPR